MEVVAEPAALKEAGAADRRVLAVIILIVRTLIDLHREGELQRMLVVLEPARYVIADHAEVINRIVDRFDRSDPRFRGKRRLQVENNAVSNGSSNYEA